MTEKEAVWVSDEKMHELGIEGLPEPNDELQWCMRRDMLERAEARVAASKGS
jgi:hypothetical protein